METHDFFPRLLEWVQSLGLPMPVKMGLLDVDDTLSIIPAGGGTVRTYYSGVVDRKLNVRVMVKTRDQQLALNTLNLLSAAFSDIASLESRNNSFAFDKFKVSDEPFFQGMDPSGTVLYSLATEAFITIY